MHHKCIKDANEKQQIRYFWIFVPKETCLVVSLLWRWISKPDAHPWRRLLWAIFQHCSWVTSPRANVSVPGPFLNISRCHLLLSSLPEKGNHNKLHSSISHPPDSFPAPPPLPTPFSLFFYSHPLNFIFLKACLFSLHHLVFSFRLQSFRFISLNDNGSETWIPNECSSVSGLTDRSFPVSHLRTVQLWASL